MEGLKVVKTLELGDNIILAKFDDDSVACLKVISSDIPEDEVNEFFATANKAPAEKTEKTKKSEAKEESEKEPEAEEAEGYTWADLEAMTFKELSTLCKDNDLDTDPEDYAKDELEEFMKEVADEIGVKPPKKKKADKEEEEEEKEPEAEAKDDEYTWDDLKKMDIDELGELCDEGDLDTDPEDYEAGEETEFRKAIAKEMGLTIPKK